MNAAIIGYGKMGHEIERVLLERGHKVGLIIDLDNGSLLDAAHLAPIDVAIEFTTPATAFDNVMKCLKCGVAVVCGTTGWNDRFAEAESFCKVNDGTLFRSSNFSIGVNILFAVNRYLASLMASRSGYSASIEETHHIHKLDSPSGTAVSLAEDAKREGIAEIPITSFRVGEVAGEHIVRYDSADDFLELRHSAKSRRGLAVGAVLAAEYAVDHKGVLNMNDLLNIK